MLIGETHDDHTAHVLEQLIVGHLKPAALTLEMAESRTADMEAACQAGEVEHGLHLARKEESGGGGSGADNGGGDGGWGGSGGYDAVGGALDLDDPARMIAPGWDRHVYGTLARIPRSYGGRCVAANPPRAHVSIARRAGVDGLRQLPADEQYLLPPLDSSLHLLPHGTAYRNALLEVFGAMKEPEGMMRAQGLWDAVQAWTILRTLAEEQLRVAATEADSNAAGGGEGKGDSEMHPHAKHAAAEHGTSPQVVHVCGMFHISHFGGVVEQMKHYLSHPASHFNTLELDLASEAVVVVILPGSPPPPPAERDDGTFADDVLSWADDLAKDVQVQGMAVLPGTECVRAYVRMGVCACCICMYMCARACVYVRSSYAYNLNSSIRSLFIDICGGVVRAICLIQFPPLWVAIPVHPERWLQYTSALWSMQHFR